MRALTDNELAVVKRRSPDSYPPDHARPWAGSPGGAWRFWNEIHAHRCKHPFSVLEVQAEDEDTEVAA